MPYLHVPESLSEHLRVGFFEPERLRLTLERGQLRGKLSGRDALAVFGVVTLAPTQCPVVDEPACPSHAVQTDLLSLRGTHPEPVGLPQLHSGPCALSFDVVVNRRLRHSARRCRKVCGGPHGRHLPKVSELLAKHPRGVALEPVDQLTNRQIRRRIDKHVQVVRPDGKMLNLYGKLFGFLAEQRFKPVRDGFYQHLAASARYPDEMILKHDNRPSVVSVACCHKHSVARRKGRKHVVFDARRRFILSARAGGFLASTLVSVQPLWGCQTRRVQTPGTPHYLSLEFQAISLG